MAARFSKWQRQLFTEAGKGNLEEALRMVQCIEKDFPEKSQKTSLWKAALYCASGKKEEGLATLVNAEKEGAWWHPDQLLRDPDFESIRQWPAFQEMLVRCKKKLEAAQAEQDHKQPIVWSSIPKSPLVFSIHWRGDNARNFTEFWDEKRLRDRFTFVFPQSSQVFGPDSFCWDDWDCSKRELLTVYRETTENIDCNNNRTIIAGASQGGKLAIELALEQNEISAKGFVAIVPAIREVDQYAPLIQKAAARGIRSCIITGDQDHFFPEARALCTEFEKYDLPCKLIVSEGLGHFFPDDFPDCFMEAVDFIFGG